MPASLTLDQIESVLRLAARAPSGDNTQPWSFLWDGRLLTVLFHPSRARHVLDAGMSAAEIALGCLLESIEIAVSTHGFAIDAAFLGFHDAEESPVAEVRFVPSARLPDSLLDALPLRSTDRRPFRRGTLPVSELNEVLRHFPHSDRAQAHFQPAPSQELLEYILAAECLVASHPSIFLETLPWIRLSARETARTLDGMPWRGTGVSALQYPALQFMRGVPRAFPLLAKGGMKQIHAATVKKLLSSSAGLFCLSVAAHAPLALLSAGRLAMRLWLRLTQLGFGVQPLTISSLSMYNARLGVLDPHSRRLFGAHYAAAEQLFHTGFSIPSGFTPVWLLRTGLSSPLPKSWFTPRKNLESQLKVTV